jgi:DNA-binding XRE family transcriptional regulator
VRTCSPNRPIVESCPPRRPSFEEAAHRQAFGAAIRRERLARGWTQEQFAERADVHRSYLADLETGTRNPTLDMIVKLANGLHLSVRDLFA